MSSRRSLPGSCELFSDSRSVLAWVEQLARSALKDSVSSGRDGWLFSSRPRDSSSLREPDTKCSRQSERSPNCATAGSAQDSAEQCLASIAEWPARTPVSVSIAPSRKGGKGSSYSPAFFPSPFANSEIALATNSRWLRL